MDLSAYSAKTAGAVKAAYAKAMAVFKDENADQKEVDAAVAELEKAIAAASGSVSGEKDETAKSEDKVASDNAGNKTTKGKTNKVAGNTAAKTGDAANPFALAGLVLLSGIVLIEMRKRKAA